eukprot:gnl/TRDRNA2_/TRDRNA2_90270_c0_seq1.p1 gnl/TRDRNA2_/TRDRNA2_90270_c0~~gnl/TRDRNA2_/TRDRNA2_90270_c0_seq1.p1  ORF type:complete len:260 (+),score=41.84 gnl/TRDRNA2_/TRDRNA2_90270_c0_seq1:69-782(+)
MAIGAEVDDDWEARVQEPPDYGNPEFWEAHFSQAPHGGPGDPAALEYEWVCSDVEALARLLAAHLPDSGRVLHPGCGMSLLPLKLLDASPGLEVLSLDASPSCVEAMRAAHCHAHSRLMWEARDVREMGDVVGWNEPFAAAVEKGCLDALLCDSDESAARYVSELARVLPPRSPLLLISNSPVRHRHLVEHFIVKEVLPLGTEVGGACPDELRHSVSLGGTLFLCERRPSSAQRADG